MSVFKDKAEAGRRLAEKLKELLGLESALVLALPNGGVPVAYEVAVALNLDLDVFVVRKLRVPDREEMIMGIIATGGVRVLSEDIIQGLGIPDSVIARVAAQEQRQLQRQEKLYRPGKTEHQLKDRLVIAIDDGMATGASMRAALAAIRSKNPSAMAVAVPVAGADAFQSLRGLADRLTCVVCVENFGSFGRWYASFERVADDEVQGLLTRAETIAGHGL